MPQMNARMNHLRIFVIIYLIVAVLLTQHIQAQQNGDIRLINNTILEAYLSGNWGAVCDDFWSLANTHVACRELGFRRGDAFYHGILSDTGTYHLDDVVCLGNESSITECRYRLGDDCSNHEKVWITCEAYGCESFAPFADSIAITVKYYAQVRWYYISSEDFTNENAEVICRENTNRGVESYTYQSREATSSTPIYQYHFTCAGNESSLCECEKSPASITSDLIVNIKCQSSEGKLKLVSGVNEHSGYVLINHEDTWKAICVSEDDSNFQLAYVACIHLGYKGVYNYYYDTSLDDIINGGNYFYTRSRQMGSWLTQPHCTGNEKFVTQCNGTWENSVCNLIPLWINCEVHQLHDVELHSTTGSQYEGETYILYDNKRSHLCLPDGIFDSTLGNAICRTIGAPSYQNWRSIVSDDAEFLNLQYTCFGNEDNLASCFSSVLEHRRCEILYLICNPPADETPRISYGSTEVGLVDIYARQKWGLSCMSNSGRLEASDAQVICKELGLSGNGLQLFDYPITQPQNYWNSVFNCLGTESSLAEGNCLQTTGYNYQCPTSTNVAAKIICRPSKSQLRLIRSTIDNNYFLRVEYLTPERTWAPVCYIPSYVEICKKFDYNAPDITRSVPDNAHTYAQLDCPSSDIDTCDVNFKYDYNSYFGCPSILEVSCTNKTVPTIKPENIRVHVLSSTSVLLIWDYLYEITEGNMGMVYRYELTTDRYTYTPKKFGVYHWGRDHSRISRRYQMFNGLLPNSSFALNLRLVNAAGFGPYGNAVRFTTHEADALSPEITQPVSDQIIRITSISELESFSLNQRCVSTGFPVPMVRWTSNTNVNPSGTVLSLRSEDLDLDVINTFTCMATNIGGSDSKTVRIFIQIQLGTPGAPIADTVDATSIRIHWAEYASAVYNISYTVCVRKSVDTSCTQTIHSTQNAVAVRNLEASTTYGISITVNTIFGTSPRSLSLSITTDDLEPVRPEITTPQYDVSSIISSISEFESFSFTQNCISTGIPTPTITWTSNTNSNLNVISDTLTLNTQDLNPEISINIFTCTATNTAGQDSKSIAVNINIESQLSAPQPPTQQSIDSNSVDIQWVEYISSVYAKSYEICVRSTTDTECIQTINTVSTQYSIGSLESATAYRISIVAITVFGRSPTGVPLIVTTNEPEPVLPEITTPQQDIHLTISSVSEFEYFSFTQDCISTGVPTPTITWTSNTSTLDVTNNRLSILARHLNKKIEVNIFTCTATNSIGLDASQIFIINTIELSIPEKPTDISISTNSIEIQWSDYDIVDYLVFYEICVSIPGTNNCEQRNETTETRLTIRNLQPSSQYSITIVVFTYFGTSPRSTPLYIITSDLVAPIIVVPAQDQQITIYSLNQLEMFTLTQECTATGVPKPSIEWYSNGSFYQSDSTLILQVGDLKGGIDMRFTCTASNDVGSDSKSIQIVTSIQVFPVAKLIITSKYIHSIGIQWLGESRYLEYDVSYQICLRKSDNGDDCIQEVSSTVTKYLFENLENDTLYRVAIVTITSFGRSRESREFEVKTEEPIIIIVEDLAEPEIITPSKIVSINITTIEGLSEFSMNESCISSGFPEPVIIWTSNTDYISNDRLIIQPGDFSIDDFVNPYEFTCTANNTEGEDSSLIRIRVDIDLTKMIGNLSHVTSEILVEYTEIIQRNIRGVNYTYEQHSVVREVVDRSASSLDSLVQKFNDTDADTDVLETILQTGDDIIQLELQQPVVVEVEITERAKDAVATASEGVIKILNTIETVALSLLNNIPDNETASIAISSPSITVVAENYVLPEEDDGIDKLTIPDAAVVRERDIKEKIQIPISVARSISKNNTNLRIATTIIKNDVKSKPEDSDIKASRLHSNIVSVVVSGYESGKMMNFPELVRFIMPVPATDSLTQFQNCSHLNRSSWSTNGLTTNATDHNITFCDSDHFTSFAVFVTPREIPDDNLSRIASIVSYVLVSISFVALIISLILFLLSGKNFFKVEANIVYFNYCIAMTLAFGLFLFGIESGKFHIIMCMVIAFLLHYIWLAVFVWTLCNGILIMYKLTIGILREHKIYPYLIVFGWCFPLIIPIITIAIKHKNYVKPEEHCFITHEDGLIWSFIGPILIILSINLIILAFATIRIATTKFGTEKIDEKQALRKGLLSLMILTPLLGIPWLLLLLNLFIMDPIVQWSFILINGLMGVFFFLAITLRNTEVKKLCAKSTKESSHHSTSFSDGKSSGLLSRKFKRSISRDSEEVQSPTGPPGKGTYIPLGPVFEDSDTLKSRYDAPSVPRNLPKARKLSKGSSESEEPPHYDIPVNLKPVDPYYDVLKPKEEFPLYEEIRQEHITTEFGDKPEIKSSKVSEKKLYQNLDSNP